MKKILVAEDDEVNRAIVAKLLSNAHYETIEATNGVQALEHIEKHPDISLAILDINMPEISGLQVARKIRGKIPFIILTVDTREETINECINVGAFNYLLKPVIPDLFLPMLETALARGGEYNSIKKALESTPVIHAAAGIIMSELSIPYDEALEMLKKYASSDRKKMVNIAEEIVNASNIVNRSLHWIQKKIDS